MLVRIGEDQPKKLSALTAALAYDHPLIRSYTAHFVRLILTRVVEPSTIAGRKNSHQHKKKERKAISIRRKKKSS